MLESVLVFVSASAWADASSSKSDSGDGIWSGSSSGSSSYAVVVYNTPDLRPFFTIAKLILMLRPVYPVYISTEMLFEEPK